MASGNSGCSGTCLSVPSVSSTRCVNLEFPPPPPYPPPKNEKLHNQCIGGIIGAGGGIKTYQNTNNINTKKLIQDYSYACYEGPGPSRPYSTNGTIFYPNYIIDNPGSRQHWAAATYHLHRKPPVRDSSKRHTYVTRYGTEENIYEEISEISRQCQMGISSSRRSLVAEEVRRVQFGHRRILGELNLSVEAMLMPSMNEDNEEHCQLSDNHHQINDRRKNSSALFLCNDDSMAPIGCDLDSGFSGSSSASYRSGLGSLRRDLGKSSLTSSSCTKLIGSTHRKNKASMIWKKGWKGWKKLGAFGSPSKIGDEPRSRCQSWDDVGGTARMETITKRQDQKPQQQQQQQQQLPQHAVLEATSSNASVHSIKSEDSWCSASDHEHSSDDESEKSNISVKSNCQLRNTLNKAKTLCDKWRSQNIRLNNSTETPLDSSVNNQGRLSRWFSIRRGSTHQYDIDSSSDTSTALLCSPIKQQHQQHHQQQQQQSSPSSSTPTQQSPSTHISPMSRLAEVEEESYVTGSSVSTSASAAAMMQFQCIHRRQAPPTLPPAPPNLTPQQLKRRHIVAAIVHSENSYVATLQRLVNDYKKQLEESSPPVLSQTKIATLFHRLPEILQCHTLFRIALAECVRSWDKDEKLGDVFVANFSKAIVLDIYSGFINNFSVAMDLAKQESKRKTALNDFFKVKQISAHDRLSFFGLMVKPVQRFPQFILFLQDLLKHTPQGHDDRMSLQLALTQLESLAEMLNERKREAEQFQAFKEMLRHVSGKLSHRPLSSSSRYLIREDNVTQLEFNQNGMITKSKRRRLLLLNDLVVCVSVTPRSIDDFSSSERLTLKWTYPVSDIEIQDTSTSPTLSRLLTAGLNKGGSLKSEKSGGMNESSQAGADSICAEMNDLMHDYEVVSRINDLVTQLKGTYEGMTVATTKQILQSIQSSIQQKDEDMIWADSCCLQLMTKQGQMYTFQTDNPLVKKDWITELRLAQLALDPNNSPSWEVPEQEQRPSTKMPLFVSSQSVYHSQHKSEVRCGCYYTTQNQKPTRRRITRNPQSYLWICTSDGVSSHVTVFNQSTSTNSSAITLKKVSTFDLFETRVAAIEFIKGFDNSNNNTSKCGDQVWMGTDSRKIIIYSAIEPEKNEELFNLTVSGSVIQIKYHCDNVFVALGNGTLIIYKRQIDGTWGIISDTSIITLGNDPVACLMPINSTVYAACGKKVWVLSGLTGEIIKNFSVQHEHLGNVKLMAHSGVGLWVALKNSSTVCLYHTETFKHLQDINIASNILRVTKSSILDKLSSSNNNFNDNINININNQQQQQQQNSQLSVTVTALMACKGLLWVGTNVGISLTIPLPRLEGVPIISGRVNISYHAHFGPITFLLAIQNNKNWITTKDEQQIINNNEQEIELQQLKNQQTEDEINQRNRTSIINESSATSTASSSSFSYNVDKLKQHLSGSPVALRRKRNKDNDYRGSKTLPRGFGGVLSNNTTNNGLLSTSITSSQSSGENCDVYGLYSELMILKDYDNDNNSGIDPMYESLRRSDPELAAIPNKVNTLDRRLKMKITRPRSLDLSNWSVDSHASSLYTSSGSEENIKNGKLSRNSSTTSRTIKTTFNLETLNTNNNNNINTNNNNNVIINNNNNNENNNTQVRTLSKKITGTTKRTNINNNNSNNNNNNNNKTQQQIEQPKRTVLTLMGGRGYVNWRQLNSSNHQQQQPFISDKNSKAAAFKEPNSNDAHIVLWEMKL